MKVGLGRKLKLRIRDGVHKKTVEGAKVGSTMSDSDGTVVRANERGRFRKNSASVLIISLIGFY